MTFLKNNKLNEITPFFIIFIIIVSFIFIFYNEIYRHAILHEGMDNKNSTNSTNSTIILMGDSILKNNIYVGKGKSVEDLLIQQYDGTLLNLAKDETTIQGLDEQINELTNNSNNKNNINKYNNNQTTIFVSAGGNDILNKYVYIEDADIDNFKPLYVIYARYNERLKRIRAILPNAKIMLINLYYPQSVKYLKYREIIKKWNDLLFEYQSDPIHKIDNILDLSILMTDINDFSLCIEPSATGSVKIAREILVLSKL